MISTEVVRKLEENKQRRLNGEQIAIPYPFKRLSDYLPGIEQGKIIGITAGSKTGKTQLADYILFEAIDWYIANKNKTNIKLKIWYFSLEVSKELKLLSAISFKLFKEYKIVISPQKLRSVFGNYILSSEILEIIKSNEFQIWLKEFEEVLELIDSVRNSYGIYSTIKAYAEQNGRYTYKTIDWDNKGKIEKREVIDKYVPNNPNEFVIIVTDHLGLLHPEKNDNLYQTIGKFSSNYCLSLRDRYNYTMINIQQQSADSTDGAFDYRGDVIINKAKPTPEGLSDNKSTKNDLNLLIGLFWPRKYNIETYNGINLNKIGDYHRELCVLLNRDGLSNLSIDLMFLGAANHFRELPKTIDESIYTTINQLKQNEI